MQRQKAWWGIIAGLFVVLLATGLTGKEAEAAPRRNCGEVLVSGSSWLGGAGVPVRSNGGLQTTGDSCGGDTERYVLPDQYGFAWQCVELANRLYATKGWYTQPFGVGTAKNLFPAAAHGTLPGLVAMANGSGYRPIAGDLIIHSNGTYGHVSIVDRVERGTVYAVEQNNSADGRTSYSISSAGLISRPKATISGVVHATKNVAANQLLQASDGSRHYLQHVDGILRRRRVETDATVRCLVAAGATVIPGVNVAELSAISEGTPYEPCIDKNELRGKIARVPATGTSYYVDSDAVRHWVPDGETFLCLVARGAAVIDYEQRDVDTLSPGANQLQCLDPARFVNKIIQAPDNYSYLIDATGKRHWIPNGGTFLCLKAWRGHPVVGGLTWDHVRSLEEIAPAASCSAPEAANKIIRVSATGTAYFVDANQVRHWIPDGETYLCLTGRGYGVIDNLTQDHASALAEGGWQARCLDPARARNTIIRESGGTSYYVDWSAVRHWIPDGYTFECIQARGVGMLNANLTWEHINSLPEGGRHGYCLAAWRVRNKVVRASDGTAYWVDGSDYWHWIRDGAIYNCLVSRYGLAGTFSWEHINSLRREGAWATC